MRQYDYVIFHKNCLDGFTGFVILNNTGNISKDATIYPDIPAAKNAPHDIDNKNVIIIDVAYKYDVLREIMGRANSVTFIDHHVTIKNDVEKLISELSGKDNLVVYDQKMSGASLTWKYFYPDKKMPLFVKYIQDNDIGAWKMKYTKYFITGLEVNYRLSIDQDNLTKWNLLFDKKNVESLIKKGITYSEYKNYLLDSNSQRYSLERFPSEKIYEDFIDKNVFVKPAQYKVAVYCGSGCPSGTELARKILETVDCDFTIMWVYNMDRKEYVLSFRSENIDVGTIAKLFGGGGHTLASACSFPLSKYNITDLFYGDSLPRQPKATN